MVRSKKDPNKPKGRTTAYAFFVQSEREAMRAKNLENGEDAPSFTELSKFCGGKWKCLDDEEKVPFYKLAEADKTRYDQEMANYTPSEDEETPKKSRKRKRRDDENHPKRNKSAYLFFCEEERPKVKESHPELVMTEVSKVLGSLWSAVSEKQKEKFGKLAQTDKDRYAKEMEEYKLQSADGPDESVSKSKKQRELVK